MRMRSEPGTYILWLKSESHHSISVGRWGELTIQPGFYGYVGSAFGPGGVRARVSRHCRAEKRQHWHIDYLRPYTTPTTIWYSHTPERLEHIWANGLLQMAETIPIKGFGSSDCQCESHLCFMPASPNLNQFEHLIQHTIQTTTCTNLK